MPKGGHNPWLLSGLRVARKNTVTSAARIMPSFGAAAHLLGARVEYRVELGAILEHFPRAGEARRHHESFSRTELPAFARKIFQCHPSARQGAELRFRILDAPLAARARPDAGVELLARVAE